jgi:hypothetical protein
MIYASIGPFYNVATGILMERDFFKTPPEACRRCGLGQSDILNNNISCAIFLWSIFTISFSKAKTADICVVWQRILIGQKGVRILGPIEFHEWARFRLRSLCVRPASNVTRAKPGLKSLSHERKLNLCMPGDIALFSLDKTMSDRPNHRVFFHDWTKWNQGAHTLKQRRRESLFASSVLL